MRPSISQTQLPFVQFDPSARYARFRDILGKGAMKTVYRAFDMVLGTEVAWSKVLLNDVLGSPYELHRLYSEVHLLKNLNHDSIIRFYHSWIDIDHKTFNFITEMFTSGTLRQYRQKYKQVDIRAIKNWARQILRGLVYLHNCDPPIIHRDLKCDNIFVNGHLGQVKIGDLGLAAVLRGSRHAHSVIGTPEFMAPELYEEEYNELVDIYSFGMCVLEMLTSEYPYSECSNPAQIYKKVTSGKKPEAFYRIQDVQAKQFVSKCLETASKRLPAHELLLDPFLTTDKDVESDFKLPIQVYSPKGVIVDMPFLLDNSCRSTDMTITGTVNPEDNTLFLKVQLSGKNGHVKHVHFPFDIVNDTVLDVAMEMVEELDIIDWEPQVIAEMIEEEISALVPGWKDLCSTNSLRQDLFEDDDDKPFPYSSSSAPSHDSLHNLSELSEALSSYEHACKANNDWFQDSLGSSEDASSESSCCLGTSPEFEYSSGNYEEGCNLIPDSGRRINIYPQVKCNGLFGSSKDRGGSSGQRKLSKTRLFMDIRSQLLLMRALNKRYTAKTVGAMENIGFHHPC